MVALSSRRVTDRRSKPPPVGTQPLLVLYIVYETLGRCGTRSTLVTTLIEHGPCRVLIEPPWLSKIVTPLRKPQSNCPGCTSAGPWATDWQLTESLFNHFIVFKQRDRARKTRPKCRGSAPEKCRTSTRATTTPPQQFQNLVTRPRTEQYADA